MIRTGKKFSKPKLSRIINGDDQLPETPEAPEKIRLDHLLVAAHPEYNRSSLQHFIKAGYVSVDGAVATKPNLKFPPDAKITLTVPEREQLPPCPPILYEDDYVKVLDKPAGLLSMAKGEYCAEATLEDYGLLVHRLDRDTSGVVILAKDPDTQKMLRRQFQNRKAHKVYYALVNGRPKLDSALIDLPIARNLKHPTTFIVDQNGKPSQTAYRVVETDGHTSLLELHPTTGRTHQLRVHLKYLGTPIIGDQVYNPATVKASQHTPSQSSDQPRLMLHASSLEITIPSPAGNVRRTFSSPLPPEFHITASTSHPITNADPNEHSTPYPNEHGTSHPSTTARKHPATANSVQTNPHPTNPTTSHP